jgi:translation initiation factor 3 subunit C
MDIFDRQIFNGPPENNRDVVTAAAKALSTGNWKACEELLLSLKVWALMPNADTIKANLRKYGCLSCSLSNTRRNRKLLPLHVYQYADVLSDFFDRKIQEEGLCTYLFSYSHFYDSLSLKDLASMFELEPNRVHSLVSKMMISEELHASWDQPTGKIPFNFYLSSFLDSSSFCTSFKKSVHSYVVCYRIYCHAPRRTYQTPIPCHAICRKSFHLC